MVRWLAAIYTLITSLIIAFVLLTITGLIHPQDKLIEYSKAIPAFAPYIETYYIGAQWQDWHAEKQAELGILQREIEEQRTYLQAKEEQLQNLSQSLARQEQALNEQRAKSLSAANLAKLYSQMRPEEAVAIMELMDQQLVLDVLLAMDQDTAASILAALPPSMAAQLSMRFQEGR
ncbi:MAG: hypothetical protein WAP20_00640 [Limnochordia bacterium]|nr:hypothetical protein [Bacillota bacterium]HOB08020.1 hypothetical protein [Limnochordia bacterium]NLH31625.1 hypothetical protein [Bacillota bacterium]HPT92186.1 hypothetical protein [Limnochordia bacterium]HPZ29827.1 hypothetical protein [Limnochordia bacterium]